MYASYADLISAHEERTIVQLADENGDGVADTAVIDAALAKADAEIHARVSRRYAVPLDPVPALAVQLATTLAIGFLYARRPGDMPTSIKEGVSSAKSLLDSIGAGRAMFGESTPPTPDASNLDVRISSQPRIFNRTGMKGF